MPSGFRVFVSLWKRAILAPRSSNTSERSQPSRFRRAGRHHDRQPFAWIFGRESRWRRFCGRSLRKCRDPGPHGGARRGARVVFGLLTVLQVIFGELVPKSLSLARAERVALLIARPFNWFLNTFRWAIDLLDGIGRKNRPRARRARSSQPHPGALRRRIAGDGSTGARSRSDSGEPKPGSFKTRWSLAECRRTR